MATKFVQRQESLLTRRQCPECGKVMLAHTLLHKHICHGNAEAKKKMLQERMDQRILERGTTKFVQRQESLLSRRPCPGCGKTMLYHTLLHKHVCRGNAEAKKKWLLERMDQRILERGVPGNETERLQRTKKRTRKIDTETAATRTIDTETADVATFTDES